MKGDDIADRLLGFGLEVLKVVSSLPSSGTGKHLGRQLMRSGTSGGANYEEARAAESRSDFAHKVSLAAKEVSESVYWLRLIRHSHLARHPHLDRLVREGKELTAILKSSAQTARSRS